LLLSVFNDTFFQLFMLYSINRRITGKCIVGSCHGIFKVLSQHRPGDAEENQGRSQSASPISMPRVEPETFRIRSKSANHSAAMFHASLKDDK
jgi:hypothetical protein